MKIAILGAGAFGTALGGVLADNGYDIDYYDVCKEKERLSDAVKEAKFILLSVPSVVAPHMLPHLPKNIPLIVATKGILTDAIFAEFKDWMVLSGPGFAADIKAAKPTHLTATDLRITELFKIGCLDFDQTLDKKGVLMCGALKNVYAIGAGLRNLQSGTKEHEAYLREAAAEIQALLLINGADPRTVELNCGRGDLRVTCSLMSRNYKYGQKLREHSQVEPETVEGLAAIRRIKRGEIDLPGNLKILEEILDEIEC